MNCCIVGILLLLLNSTESHPKAIHQKWFIFSLWNQSHHSIQEKFLEFFHLREYFYCLFIPIAIKELSRGKFYHYFFSRRDAHFLIGILTASAFLMSKIFFFNQASFFSSGDGAKKITKKLFPLKMNLKTINQSSILKLCKDGSYLE